MLDKSLPYYDIIMNVDYATATAHNIIDLPDGYCYKMYKDGDEHKWAQLEKSVNEFDTTNDALAYFNKVFAPHREELYKRMCFILNREGQYVATSTAWYKEDEDNHYPLLHWVSVSPDEQGLGLGKAIVIYALHQFLHVEEANDIYLHTQTWSAPAVGLYGKLGFFVSYENFFGQSSDKEAKAVLETILKKEIIDMIYIV